MSKSESAGTSMSPGEDESLRGFGNRRWACSSSTSAEKSGSGSPGVVGADEHVVADADEEVGPVLLALQEDRDLDGFGLALPGDGGGQGEQRLRDVVRGDELLAGVGDEFHAGIIACPPPSRTGVALAGENG